MASRRYRTPLLTLLLMVSALAPMASQPGAERVDVIIAFRDAPGAADEALVRSAGGEIKQKYHLVPAFAARLPEQAVAVLSRNPRIAAIEPDGLFFAVDAELDNSWGVKRIGAGTVHAADNRGAGVKVAVIDSGIDYNHPDLAANYAGGYDFVNNDDQPLDDNKHGTHVAGSIAARDDDAGVVGVAPEARLYALKVLAANGSGSFTAVISAIQWAVDHDIQVTNMSFGSTSDPGSIVKAAFDNAAAGGMLHIAAAGNNGTCEGTGDNVLYPARWASVVAVAATDSANVSPCFSSTGPTVEISAPGVSVNSTIPGGGYELLSGTSMASPHVAGVAALVIASGITDTNGDGHVNDEVRQRLISTAQDLGSPGRDTWYGYGLVDAVAAVQAPGPPPPPPPPPDPSVTVTVTTNKTSYTSGVDTAAQLTAVVKDENGAAIPGLAAAAFVTSVDGVDGSVAFSETTTPGSYTGSLSLPGVGSHSVTVTAIDSRGLADSGSASFTVTPPNTVKVKSITYSTWGGYNQKRNLLLTVKIVDGGSFPISGATVSVILYRNGLYYGAANGLSNSAGNAEFEARGAPSGCYQTLVVAVIAGTRVWDELTPPNSFCK